MFIFYAFPAYCYLLYFPTILYSFVLVSIFFLYNKLIFKLSEYKVRTPYFLNLPRYTPTRTYTRTYTHLKLSFFLFFLLLLHYFYN